MMLSKINNTALHLNISPNNFIEHKYKLEPIANDLIMIQGKTPSMNIEAKENQKKAEEYLSIETIIKITNKFLDEKNMPRGKLAELLGIATDELEAVINKKAGSLLISKINLPLIRLYCATKFQQPTGENKDAISKFKKYV